MTMTVTDTRSAGAGAGASGSSGDPLGPVGGAGDRLLATVAELIATPAVELDPVSSLQRTEAVLRARSMLRAVRARRGE